MTTNVTIDAHCADTKEVFVHSDTGHGDETVVLQDGESITIAVHEPEHHVTVYELNKE